SQPAIVFVHGAAFDHSVWQWQSRYLAHHGFTVLAVDLPAHGRSPGPMRTSIGGFADWVAALLDAAGLPSAALVGHSMGSLIALETALRVSHRVTKLALVGAAVPMPVGKAFLAAAPDDAVARERAARETDSRRALRAAGCRPFDAGGSAARNACRPTPLSPLTPAPAAGATSRRSARARR